MILSPSERIALRQSRSIIEMATFNEEQQTRRFYGPQFFRSLMDELTAESDRINQQGERLVAGPVPAASLAIRVRDQTTGHVLEVEYDAGGAAIRSVCREKTELIAFRVLHHPVPSVVAVVDGQSLKPIELSATLLEKLIR